MWDGVHTIIFVVVTFAAGRPNRRTSNNVCYSDFGVGSSLSATDVQCRCNGN